MRLLLLRVLLGEKRVVRGIFSPPSLVLIRDAYLFRDLLDFPACEQTVPYPDILCLVA